MTANGYTKPFLAFIWFLTLHGVTRNVFFSFSLSFYIFFCLIFYLVNCKMNLNR